MKPGWVFVIPGVGKVTLLRHTSVALYVKVHATGATRALLKLELLAFLRDLKEPLAVEELPESLREEPPKAAELLEPVPQFPKPNTPFWRRK